MYEFENLKIKWENGSFKKRSIEVAIF